MDIAPPGSIQEHIHDLGGSNSEIQRRSIYGSLDVGPSKNCRSGGDGVHCMHEKEWLASDFRANSFRLASDCLNVIKSIQQGDLKIYGQIIQEINVRKTTFISVKFVREHI